MYCVLILIIRWNNRMVNDYKIKFKKESRFKKYMAKSGEGIMILNDKTIEYINDKFI